MKKVYQRAGAIFAGNIVAGVLNLMLLAILTHSLSLEAFGIFALVTSYFTVIGQLTSFQTWQAVIYYGAHALAEPSPRPLTSLLALTLGIDIAAGIMGAILAILGGLFAPTWFGLGAQPLVLSAIGALMLIFNLTGTSIGVLRLFNRFYLQTANAQIACAIRAALAGTLVLMGIKSLLFFVAIWAAGGVIGQLCLFAIAWREASRQGLIRFQNIAFGTLRTEYPGLVRFLFATNLDGTIKILRELDIFIVKATLGPAAAGLYRVIRVIKTTFGQLINPFFQSIYPALANLAVARDAASFRRLIVGSSLTVGLLASVVWIIFAFSGRFIIDAVFGAPFVAAVPAALLASAGTVAWAFEHPLAPALLALGRPQWGMVLHLATSLLYLAAIFYLTLFLGLVGTGVATALFYLIWGIAVLGAVWISFPRLGYVSQT